MTTANRQFRGRHADTRSAVQKVPAATFLVVIHALPIVALILGASVALATFGAMYVFLALGVGIGLHRYFSHRSFKTSRVFQFILGLWCAATFTDPIGFAGKHRLHHRHSDTGSDPHGPRSGFWHCWFGSLLDEGYTDSEVVGVARDLAKYPELMLLHRFFWIPGAALALVVYIVGGFPLLALGYCAPLALLVNLTSSVNYFCHVAGTRRYPTRDDSRNNALVALLTFGEGWHNNHHYYPTAARAGFLWWQLDPLYWCIRLLALLRIVWDVRGVPEHLLHAEHHPA